VALSASGRILAVGAPISFNATSTSYNQGAAFVFAYSNGQWTQLQVSAAVIVT
jgi:hypothetical protein